MRLWDFGTLGSGGIASLEDRSAVAVLAVVGCSRRCCSCGVALASGTTACYDEAPWWLFKGKITRSVNRVKP